MTVRFDDFYRLLAQVNPQDVDHAYLYEVKNGPSTTIELFTQQEYETNQHSCRKLSLREIVDLTNGARFIDEKTDIQLPLSVRAKLDIGFQIANLIQTLNISLTDAQEQIAKELNSLVPKVDNIQKASNILNTMLEKARQKRAYDKTKGIWSKIKWYIWHWCCDQSHRLERIIQKMKEEAPSPQDVYQCAQKEIQYRVFVNIDIFEEQAQVPATNRTSLDKMEALFALPQDVKKKWLITYAADKYRQAVPEKAAECRTRITSMLKIWDDINKLIQKSQANMPADFRSVFCTASTFLLEN